MGFLVKEILRRLCVEFGWAYAVFWKTIGCGDQMHLVWEDGHYERSSTASPASGFEAMDMLIKESGLLRSSQNGCQAEDRVRMLFKKMATQVHFIGDGVIGKAALTGNHEWVFGDDESISKGLLDINNQLCAGIKTIAIIPVLPHDIVQLGSSQMVHQNLGFINHVRALFEQLQFVPGTLLPSTTRRNLHQKIQPHETVGMQASFKHFGELGSDIFNLSNSRVVTEPYASSTEFYDQMLPNVSEVPLTKENMQSTMLPLKPHPMVHRATNPICQMNNPLETVSNSRKHFQPPTDLSYSRLTFLEEEPHSMSELANNFEPTFANTNILQLQSFGSTSLNPLQGSEIVSSFVRSPLLNCANDLGKFNSFSSVPKSFKSNCADLSKTEVPQVLIATDHSIYNQMFTENFDPSHLNSIDHKSQSESSTDRQKDSSGLFQLSSLQSSLENDLFDVLHLDQYKSGLSQCNLDEMEVGHVFNALNDEVDCNGMFSEAGSDQLLDAVVSQFNPGAKYEMDDDELCKTSVTKIRSSSLHTSSASPKKMHDETFGLPPVLIKSEPAAAGSMKSSCSMETNAGYKSQINLWIEGQKINHDNQSVLNGRKVELGKVNRKRSRPGENPRPRPKDRQMIQDRVKELREIIPNGAKCSIDALLEKTIKHMLFLQSVTKHADKLKVTGEPKIISKEGGLLLKDNFEGGATWAFEVGSQSMICPIIVEDLNPPRQLLVEMLCEERGLFLEIADLVRGLGLTILKGVMEARNDKVWARFAVEANRDVTRMEVFISLVRLLKPSMASDKTLEGANNLNKPHDMFNSPSSIPATGSSDRLW